MNLRFNIGDSFIYEGKEYEIAGIDYEDEEYPYECYPAKILAKAQEIAERTEKDIEDVLYDRYTDKYRLCASDFDIERYQHLVTQKQLEKLLKEKNKEIKGLKAEMKKPPRIVRLVLTDSCGDWDEDVVYYLANPDERKLDKLCEKNLSMNDPADYVDGFVNKNFKIIDIEDCKIEC